MRQFIAWLGRARHLIFGILRYLWRYAQGYDDGPQIKSATVEEDRSVRAAIVDALEELYAPILISLGFCGAYATLDAAHETIMGAASQYDVVIAELFQNQAVEGTNFLSRYIGPVLAMPFVVLVPITAWYSMRRIVFRTTLRNTPVVRWIARGVVHLSLILLALGPQWAQAVGEGQGLTGYLWGFTALPVFFSLCFLYLDKEAFDFDLPPGDTGRAANKFARIITGIVVVSAIFIFFNPAFAGNLGPIITVALFCVGLTILLSDLTIWSEAMPGKFPLILALLAFSLSMGSAVIAVAWFAVVLLWFIRSISISDYKAQAGLDATSLEQTRFYTSGILMILAAVTVIAHLSDPDCASLAGCNKIPGLDADAPQALGTALPEDQEQIEVLAAPGGGLFAAYHTAFYLAAKSDGFFGPGDLDADPERGQAYQDQLYAISGVSGGSVGAGVYWAIRASGVCDRPDAARNCHRQAVREILRYDLLSPALAGFFIRDFADTLFPVSAWVNRPIDRGRVLEHVLNRQVNKWAAKHDAEEDILLRPISESARGGLPVLLMNGTRVDDGTRVVASPLFWSPTGDWERVEAAPGKELSVLTAMVMSARFPVVSPPLRVQMNDGQTMQIVDGGYFDNSGLETAYDLIEDLRSPRVGTQVDIQVTALKVAPKDENAPIAMKGTIAAPVGAFVGAWRSRVDHSIDRVEPQGSSTHATLDYQFREHAIEQDSANFTLSWYLAPSTYEAIEDEVLEDESPSRQFLGGNRAVSRWSSN